LSELDPLKVLRSQIDAMDDRLVALLNERSALVIKIGKIKKKNNFHFHTPAREQAIYDRLTANNLGPFPNEALKHVFREIMGGSLSLEKKIRVAYWGQEASLAHQACLQHFSASVLTLSVHCIQDVFEAIEKGETDFGVIPIEHSTDGIQNDTLDILVGSPLVIYSEILQKEHGTHNTIRFLVVSQKSSESTTRDKTSLVLSIKGNPDELYDLLKPFEQQEIHPLKINSKLSGHDRASCFYVDIAGNQNEEKIDCALKQIAKKALFLKVLGSYPMGGTK